MTFPEALFEHAQRLALETFEDDQLREAKLRRAVSTGYYALFHRITSDAVELIAPNVGQETNHRMRRWFNHAEMRVICGRFLPTKLSAPLLVLIGESASADMQTVARNFIVLQDARHGADYDLSFHVDRGDALTFLELANDAMEAWKRLEGGAEANIFILSLLLWKNWAIERS